MKEYYTINDVAMMSGLSTRTIRNYIKMGVLDGEKVDGVWQFTPEEFEAFLADKNVLPSVQAKRNAIVYDFLLEDKKKTDAMCTVLDFYVQDEEAQEISAFFCQRINEGESDRDVRFSFAKDGNHVRVILSGSQDSIGALLAAYYGTKA